jgi:WD40 repeat protein
VVAIRPDGRELAIAAFDNTVILRDQTNGRTRTIPGATGVNTFIAFSPDSGRLAVGGGDNRIVTVWDVTDPEGNGKVVWALPGRGDTLPVVAFSPNGRLLAVASVDQTVWICDAASGQVLRSLRGHRAMLGSVAFSPDSRQLATAGNDAIVKVWDVTDLATNVGPEFLLVGRHSQGVHSLAFSPDNKSLVSAGPDGYVRFWDATMGRSPNSLLALAPPPFLRTALVNALAATTGSELRSFQGHRGAISCAVFSPDGKRVASAGDDGTVRLRDAVTGREIVSLRVPAGPVRSIVFSADGQRLATASGDRTVTVWDAASGGEIRSFQGDGDMIHGVAFRPDGRWLAAVDVIGTLQVWDPATGAVICTRRAQPGNTAKLLVERLRGAAPSRAQTRTASCVVFSSDGKRLAWTSEDLTVAIWDLSTIPSGSLPDTADAPIACLGHTGFVTSLAFSPDGNRLVSADEDGVVKLWDSKTGQEALTLQGHASALRSVAFSPDGRLIAAAGNNGTITIWDGTPLDRDPGR